MGVRGERESNEPNGPSSAPWLSGECIAERYVVQELLDKGGMGYVYAALDRELVRPVAIKVLPSEQWNDARTVERFMRQARAMARVEHRAVVRVYDRGLHENQHARFPYVIMERLHGSNLRARLAQAPVSPPEALGLICELCEAVQAVHRQGVLHRDLKPSNVFLALTPEGTQLKLLDFGIAQLTDAEPLTRTQDLLGTVAYMAPEQLAAPGRSGSASAQSDVYALACILYELLTGQPPFRARSRAELITAIAHDQAATLRERGLIVPDALEAVLRSGLAKDPGARPESAHALGRALRPLQRAPELAVTVAPAPEPQPTAAFTHYDVLHRLGEGSFGVVYAVRDRRDGRQLALKRLRSLHSEDLFRLKREFRVLSDLDHPNLVRRFELSVDDAEAFFTMEWVEGTTLLERLYQRPKRAVVLLKQAVAGLQALHARGFVHRDLKPSNVLVTQAERVVLLDFGLTVPTAARSFIAGTPEYMAPEAKLGQISPAADLYALGVLLRQLLASEPTRGEDTEQAQPVLDALWPLCAALLSERPEQRPTASQALQWLEGLGSELDDEPDSVVTQDVTREVSLFVGRTRELETLENALQRVQAGHASCVIVRGVSGIGKSALLERARERFGAQALWLFSCCRDSEAVPYPALDAAIDGLAEQLTLLPQITAAQLLPRQARALAQLFPVLQRVPIWPRHGELPADPAQVRALAYATLHRLLMRWSEQRPIVLCIDDLHWVDQDSAALLAYLLARPDAPALLLIGSVRSDLEAASTYQQLMAALPQPPQVLTLAELDAQDSRSLAAGLLQDPDPRAQLLERVLALGNGEPFLLTALARYARTHHDEPTPERAFAAWLGRNSPPVQRLLELLCVCERPLPLGLLLMAAGNAQHESARTLHRTRLARRAFVLGHESLEPYHVRVRTAVLAGMSPKARRQAHRDLAAVLALERDAWPEALVEHLAGCGEAEQAALVATQAAASASALLSFDRAAALYAVALRCSIGAPPRRRSWLQLRAAALRNAGRCVDAADALREASALAADPEDSAGLLRQAGELLLLAGSLDAGLALMAPLLQRAGLSLPSTVADALAQGMAAFEALQRRGLAPSSALEPCAPRTTTRLRVELCLSLAEGLAILDLRGLPFALLALQEALDLGDPALLQRALADFITFTATLYHNPLIEPALQLCRELTQQLGSPYARASLSAAEGHAAQFSGQFLVAEAAFELAERILLESCTFATRELAAVRNGAVLLQYAQKGDFASHLERTLTWQASAELRRDSFHEHALRLAHSIVWVAQDDPGKARVELERAALAFSDSAGAYEVGRLEFMDVVDRYEGRDDSHLNPLQGRRDMLESPAAQTPYLAGYIELQRAWGAIRALARGEHAHGERALSHSAIARLRQLGPDVWHAVADCMEANLLYLHGEREQALALLSRAENTFLHVHMLCLAACARWRRGELSQHALGERLLLDARSELQQLGVQRPERWTLAYFSLFDAERIDPLTLVTVQQPR